MQTINTIQRLPIRGSRPDSLNIRTLIADTLDIDVAEVIPSLALHDIPEWSSLEHVSLMLALEEHFDVTIEGSTVVTLNNVQAILEYLSEDSAVTVKSETAAPSNAKSVRPIIHRGLDGVYVDESAISSINGQRGELLIRGYTIEQIAAHSSFEEVFHLALTGERPTRTELQRLHKQLTESAVLCKKTVALVESMHDCHPMIMLRTALSQLGRAGLDASPQTADEVRREAIGMAARIPTILAVHHAARESRSRPDLALSGIAHEDSIAERFLHQFFGEKPSALKIQALDLAMRIHAEHGANASTFSARVTASTGADLTAAVVTALGTFAGPLHGGAVEGVIASLRETGGARSAAAYVAEKRQRHEPVMGFGHRVYKSADPRSTPLRAIAEVLADQVEDRSFLDAMTEIEAAMAPYQRHGLHMNVDCYTAVVYHLLGIPDDYFTTLYSMARIAGWAAHIAEQVERKVLIRPLLAYNGEARRDWTGG